MVRWRHAGDTKSKSEQEIRAGMLFAIILGTGGYITFIYERREQEGHRPPTGKDARFIKTMRGTKVQKKDNPGIRVVPSFVTEGEAADLVEEIKGLLEKQGYAQIDEEKMEMFKDDNSYLTSPPQPNHLRLTGRSELKGQPVASWGYSTKFDKTQVPPNLLKIAERIEKQNKWKIGPLRDITLNYRKDGWLRIDPHIDPLKDGSNNFVLTLMSDQVMTLVPPGIKFDKSQQHYSENSFSRRDIDILQEQNGLVFLFGPARFQCSHGVRNGVEDQTTGELCDWFGNREDLIPRNDERISVVFAYGPHPNWVFHQWSQHVRNLRLAELPRKVQGKRPFSSSVERKAVSRLSRFLRLIR